MADLVIKMFVHFCYLLVVYSWDNFLTFNSQSRFYVLLIVSIVSSCIDVACHVNMHFGVSAGEKIKRHCFITRQFISLLIVSEISPVEIYIVWKHWKINQIDHTYLMIVSLIKCLMYVFVVYFTTVKITLIIVKLWTNSHYQWSWVSWVFGLYLDFIFLTENNG